MKLFSSLSDMHKERAIHMSEHIVMANLLEFGFGPVGTTPEQEEHFKKIEEVLEKARLLEDPLEQAGFIFENPLTGDLIFEQAYDMAASSIYLEEGELAFSLDDMNSHFSDEDADGNKTDSKDDGSNETISKATTKDSSHLN